MSARIYLLTPPVIKDMEQCATGIEAALSTGAIAFLQIRLKGSDGVSADDDAVCALAERLTPAARRAGVPIIVNDRPDLARSLGADGVHLGPDDISCADARAMLGSEAIIGVSCGASRHMAFVAEEEGADYVAFGAFFPTRTKNNASVATEDILHWWSRASSLPCVAIGGITCDTATSLIRAGADFVAVASCVWEAPDGPGQAVTRLAAAIGWPGDNREL